MQNLVIHSFSKCVYVFVRPFKPSICKRVKAPALFRSLSTSSPSRSSSMASLVVVKSTFDIPTLSSTSPQIQPLQPKNEQKSRDQPCSGFGSGCFIPSSLSPPPVRDTASPDAEARISQQENLPPLTDLAGQSWEAWGCGPTNDNPELC